MAKTRMAGDKLKEHGFVAKEDRPGRQDAEHRNERSMREDRPGRQDADHRNERSFR